MVNSGVTEGLVAQLVIPFVLLFNNTNFIRNGIRVWT